MQTWEQTYQLPAGGGVRIEQGQGAVRVTGWDQPLVKVTATGERHPVDVKVGQDKRGLTVGVDALDLALYVPTGTPCEIESESGPVVVAGTQASVQIECGSGDIALRDVAGVQVETGSGTVAVQRSAGKIAVETGSGNIAVSDVSGTVSLEAGSGSIRAERVQGPKLTVEAGGGGLHLTGIAVDHLAVETGHGDVQIELAEVRPSGSYNVESGAGAVALAVPAGAGIDLDVETGAGKITYPGLEFRVLHAERGELRATLNGGGAQLSIETGNGNVQLRPVTATEPEARILKAVQGDAALANSDQMQRILTLVEQGKLSPSDAEAILTALDEEGTHA
jgi:DUF4097 and DUF4098 domain-containing protein YvlB